MLVDLDQDGVQDVVLHNFYRNPALALLNRSGGGNRWLRVKLRGTTSNRFGIGARVTAAGQVQEMVAGHGYLSGNAPVLHLGLGAAARVDLTVRWPSGQVDKHAGLAANRVWTLVEGDPKAATSAELKPIDVKPAEPVAPPSDPEPRGMRAGLKTLDGKAVPVEGPQIVIVFSNDCRVCTDELQRAAELEGRAKALGVQLVWVTKDPDPRKTASELRSVGCPVEPRVAARSLAGVGVPCVYLITPTRAEKYVGRFAVDAALEDAARLK